MSEQFRPWLVQRLERKTVEGSLKKLRFGEVFQPEYMGSAEYEFGAVPAFLREMAGAKLTPFKVEIQGRKVFGVYNSKGYESLQHVTDILNELAEGRIRLKEWANFPPDPTRTYSKTAAWAVLDRSFPDYNQDNAGMFWSYENMNEAVVEMFRNSLAYMDKQK